MRPLALAFLLAAPAVTAQTAADSLLRAADDALARGDTAAAYALTVEAQGDRWPPPPAAHLRLGLHRLAGWGTPADTADAAGVFLDLTLESGDPSHEIASSVGHHPPGRAALLLFGTTSRHTSTRVEIRTRVDVEPGTWVEAVSVAVLPDDWAADCPDGDLGDEGGPSPWKIESLTLHRDGQAYPLDVTCMGDHWPVLEGAGFAFADPGVFPEGEWLGARFSDGAGTYRIWWDLVTGHRGVD